MIQAVELEIVRLRAQPGPNYWRLAPVIACDLRVGRLGSLTSADVPRFNSRLLGALPSLHTHPCSRGRIGGFVERLEEGTGWPHVLEHVALELQTLVGADVEFGRVVPSPDGSSWSVIVGYEEEEVGVESVRHGVELIRACLAGDQPDAEALLDSLREVHDRVRLGPSTSVIVEEARRRGIPVRRLGTGSIVQLGLGCNLRRIRATATDATSIIAADVAQDKDITKQVLRNIGLAVPLGAVARSEDRALEIAREIGYPVILKPLAGNHGRGISQRLDDETAVRAAWAAGAERYDTTVVERHVNGRDHRVLLVNGRVVTVAERIAAHVMGDGKTTVRELIEEVKPGPAPRARTFQPADRDPAGRRDRGVPGGGRPLPGQRARGGRAGLPRGGPRATAPTRSTPTTSLPVRWPRASWGSTSRGSTSSLQTSRCRSSRTAPSSSR